MDGTEKKMTPAEELQTTKADGAALREGKNRKKNIWRIVLIVILALIAAGAVYFIQAEAQLDAALEAASYPQALACARRMPWLSFSDAHLTAYLEAHAAAARGDYAGAAKGFEPLGGYRDSTELYLAYATVSRVDDLSFSADADELLAGYEKLKEMARGESYEKNLALYRERIHKAACEKMQEKPADALRLLQAIAGETDVEEDMAVAQIIRNFFSDDRDTVYEDTLEALRPYACNEQAGKFLLSDHFINVFLEGRWETAGADFYYEHMVFDAQEGTGQHLTNMPQPKAAASQFSGGRLLVQYEEGGEPQTLYTFTVKDYDTITILNAYDGQVYTMRRVNA